MKTYSHYIGGEWLPPDSGNYIESIDPTLGSGWARIPRGNAADAAQAVQSAQQAFETSRWGRISMAERAACLVSLADLLEQEWPSLVEAEINDNGKRIVEVNAQFSGLHTWYRYFARQAEAISSQPLELQNTGVSSEAKPVPYGVIGVITPWNSPLMILAWKIAPALAAGNTVVIKPSELASASTLEFARLCQESPLPPGTVNVVTGYGNEVGEAIVAHPQVRKVTFTGSEVGGSLVAQAAAKRTIPTTLELGGKSPQVLFADANLDSALNGIVSGIFLSNGQTCVAGSRLLVADDIHDAVVAQLVERAQSLQPGIPHDEGCQIGPLANGEHLQKVQWMIAEARAEGARCVCGGNRLHPDEAPDGFYLEPTIFTDVTPAMSLWRDEVFGPVLAITRFRDEAEAIQLANQSDYGLAAGVWSTDLTKARRVADEINAGTVYINHYRSVDPGAPIGGMKSSGYGRELGPDAVRAFTQVKCVWEGKTAVPNPFA